MSVMAKVLAILSVGAALSGATPALAQAASTAPEALTMPKWSEFPVPPTDVPTLSEIAKRVAEQTAVSKALAADVAALKWDGTKAEPFKLEAMARLNPEMMKPIDKPMTQQAIEALGQEMRRRATPPPIAN